jgi:hypothetical protein
VEKVCWMLFCWIEGGGWLDRNAGQETCNHLLRGQEDLEERGLLLLSKITPKYKEVSNDAKTKANNNENGTKPTNTSGQ